MIFYRNFKNKHYSISDPKIESNRQATKEEVYSFIADGLISATGDKFISKNFDGSIRNDNMDNGGFYETFLKSPISENIHFQVNNYSNAWWIDINDLCKNKQLCAKNPDGTYDISLIIENKYNRWFFLGLLMGGLILTSFLTYLAYDWRKRRKLNNLS